MPNMVFIYPFETNDGKMAILDQILADLNIHFPDHQPCGSLRIGGHYRYYEGNPTNTRDGNDITEIRFGILTSTPPDTRKKIFGFPIGEPPEPKVVGAVHLFFEKSQAVATEIRVSVFGVQHKAAFVKFANKFRHDALLSTVKNVFVTVESELPRNL